MPAVIAWDAFSARSIAFASLRCCLLLCLLSGMQRALCSELQIDGEVIHAERIELFGMQLFDVIALPQLSDGTLSLRQLEAKAYGGHITGTIDYHLSNGNLTLDLQARGISLATVIRHFSDGDDGSNDAALSAELRVTIPGGNWQRAYGRARIDLASGTVITLPDLARFILFANPHSNTGMDNGSVQFVIRDGRLLIQRLQVENPDLTITGRGSIGAEGELDITLYPVASGRNYKHTILPLIGHTVGFLIREVSKQSSVHIGGHISAPVID